MTGIIIATHGNFAEGILHSVHMLAGEQENLAAVSLQPGESGQDFCEKVERAISSFEDPEEVLILTDLWGGTPFNQSKKIMAGHEDRWAIVTGLNLPLLVDAVFSRMAGESAKQIANSVCKSGSKGIRVYEGE